VQFYSTSASATQIVTQQIQTLVVANGSYSMALEFTAVSLDILAKQTNGNVWLEIYVAPISGVEEDTLFETEAYKMTPRVQLLAAPMAFSARGIYMDLTNTVWKVGASIMDIPASTVSANSMFVTGNMAINPVSTSGTGGTISPENVRLSVIATTNGTVTYNGVDGAGGNVSTSATVSANRAIYISGNATAGSHLIGGANAIISANQVWRARWQ
jgi:hypothetical protein